MTEKEFNNSSEETVLDEKPSEEIKEETAAIEEPETVTEIKEEITETAEEVQQVIEETAQEIPAAAEEAVNQAEEAVQAAEDQIIEHVEEKPEEIIVDKVEETASQRPQPEPKLEKVPEETKPYAPTVTLDNTPREDIALQRELKKMRDSYRQQQVAESQKVRKNNSLNNFFLVLLALLTVLLSVGGSYLVTTLANKKNTDVEPVVVYEGVQTQTVTLTSNDLSPVVSNIENAVVEVYTEMVKYGGFYGEYITGGAGSGVIYTTDGYIVTNNHVIEDARSINVKLHDGTEYTAELIATEEESDLAVIKINATGLQPAVIGDSEKLKVGETAIAIGNPLGTLGGTVTTGIVSALSREITVEGQKMTLLQTDTAISPGNSGGGLFNTAGELIAIVNAKSADADAEGIGFAIPSNVVKGVVQDLVTHGYVTGRPSIGIKCVSIESQRYMMYYNVSSYGVYVSEVISQQAIDAGLQPEDLIVEIEGQEVTSTTKMKDILYGYKAGDVVNVTVLRSRQKVTLSIPLIEKNAISN